jgi:hypothetical protein
LDIFAVDVVPEGGGLQEYACRSPRHTQKLPEDSNDLDIMHVLVPQSYLVNSWPLRNVSVAAGALDIAAAGSRGFVVYDRRSGKWRLFGDVGQERAFVAQHLGWLPDIVVVCQGENRRQLEDSGGFKARESRLVLHSRFFLDEQSIIAQRSLHQVRSLPDQSSISKYRSGAKC